MIEKLENDKDELLYLKLMNLIRNQQSLYVEVRDKSGKLIQTKNTIKNFKQLIGFKQKISKRRKLEIKRSIYEQINSQDKYRKLMVVKFLRSLYIIPENKIQAFLKTKSFDELLHFYNIFRNFMVTMFNVNDKVGNYVDKLYDDLRELEKIETFDDIYIDDCVEDLVNMIKNITPYEEYISDENRMLNLK